MSTESPQQTRPWWPRPLAVFILVLAIIAPMPASFGWPYNLATVGRLVGAAAAMAALFLLVDLIGRARSGKDTRLGMALFKVSSFPFQSKLARIEREQSAPAKLQARGLMLKDVYQAPALIRIVDEALEMIPVLGKPVIVPLREITGVVESSWFNGSWQPGQTGFMLKGLNSWRLGFAVYENPEPWRTILHSTATEEGRPVPDAEAPAVRSEN